jgi:two-component system sensor histidine kinase/response regulator
VDNAFRYSSAGSAVWVQSFTDPAGLHLVVQDRGRGMTVGQIAQVGAFHQFDRQRYEQQGLGLGLTIAKRLVDLHGGSLTINSEKAEGTTVDVRLPVPVRASV